MKPRNRALFAPSIALALTSILTGALHGQSGTWTGTVDSELWSNTANWSGGTIADGSGNTANFSTLDLPAGNFTVNLDSARTIGNLTFGDTNTSTAGGWIIADNATPGNVLTLAGTPVVTVNALGTGVTAAISAVVGGTNGLTKAGAGPLVLSGINTYSGGTVLNAGNLHLNNASAIGTGALTLNAGTLNNSSGGAIALSTNNTQSWAGDFAFAGPNNLDLGTGAVSIPNIRTVTSSAGVLTVGGVITSSLQFTKDGAGELLLNGSNLATFTGPMTIKNGIVRIRGALSATATGAALNQDPIGSTTKTITFEGGSLAINGSTGSTGPTTGAFANPLVIASGQTGTFYHAQRAALTSTVTGAGTLNFVTSYVRGDISGNFTGFSGTLNISASTTGNSDFRVQNGNIFNAGMKVNISNANITQLYNPPNNTVGTTHAIGELSGTAAAFLGGCPNSGVGARSVNWQVGALNTDSEYAGVVGNSVSGTRLYKVGTGKLTLTGANTYTGNAAGVAGTQISAGTLSVGNGGATGSLAATDVSVASGATLIFNRDNTTASTYPGILSGAGSVIKKGNGQVNFTGVNTYNAGTTLEGGILGIGNSSSLGAGAVTMGVANAGIEAQAAGVVTTNNFSVGSGLTSTFSTSLSTATHTINGIISGAGAVNFSGSGLITLGAANTYSGNTILNSGSLAVANTTGSATSAGSLTVNAGTLGGTGTIAGTVFTASGSNIKPGAFTTTTSAVGTLTTGSLALAGGSTILAEFASTSNYDKIVVSNVNGLTSTGTIGTPVLVDLRAVNSVAKWTTLGSYDLIEFSGTFTGNPNDVFAVTPASKQVGLTYTFSVTGGNKITLSISGPPPSIWNVDSNGLWSVTGNWLNGIPDSSLANAEFSSAITAPRTVTLDTNRTVGAVNFNNAVAYTIAGASTLTFSQLSGNAQANVLLGNHTISAPLQLAAPLDLFLSAATDSLALTGVIGGSGGINKISSGNLTLGGSNTFLGNLVFSNGTLEFANGGLGAGNLSLDNASLVWGAGNTQDITNRTVSFGTLPITFSMSGNVTLANNFGAGSAAPFTKGGTGNLTLAANTTFTGNINVLDGTLTLGTGGATGSVAGNITLTAATSKLVLNRTGTTTVANVITGLGTLDHPGSEVTTLTASNSFTGATTIGAGSLILGNSLALSGSTLRYDSLGGNLSFGTQTAVTMGGLSNGPNGTKNIVLENVSAAAVALTFGGNNEATTYSGNFSGLGSLVKTGTGTLTLSGTSNYSGGTTVGIANSTNAGIVELVNGGQINTASLVVTQSGSFNLVDGTLATTGNINVDSTVTAGAWFTQTAGAINCTGSFNLAANRTQGNFAVLNGGTMSAASMSVGRTGLIYGTEPVQGSTLDGLYINGCAATITGALNIGATSNATNSSANARIDGGSLAVGGQVSVGLNNGGRWSILNVNGGSFSCADAAVGVLVGGAFNGNATFSVSNGDATVERIQLGQGTIGGTHTVRVSGGLLTVGSGGIVLGDATSVGLLRLAGGVIAAKADWSTSVPVTLSGTSAVKAEDSLANPFNIAISSVISGDGSFIKEGSGTVTLTGVNTYTGYTDVAAGVLTITNDDVLSDSSFVNVSSNSGVALNLTHTGTDTVKSFAIDNVEQGPGTYGGAGSGAEHIVSQITGTGKLYVPPSDPYTSWADGYSLFDADALKSADPDHDGLINLIEFALDGDPTSGSVSGKTRSAISTIGVDNALTLTIPVRDGAVFTGATSQSATVDLVNYTIQGSDELATWNTMVISEVVPALSSGLPALNTGWTYRTFRTPGSTTADPADFIRAKVDD